MTAELAVYTALIALFINVMSLWAINRIRSDQKHHWRMYKIITSNFYFFEVSILIFTENYLKSGLNTTSIYE